MKKKKNKARATKGDYITAILQSSERKSMTVVVGGGI